MEYNTGSIRRHECRVGKEMRTARKPYTVGVFYIPSAGNRSTMRCRNDAGRVRAEDGQQMAQRLVERG